MMQTTGSLASLITCARLRQVFMPTVLAMGLGFAASVQADGMVPETSVVIVNEAEGEATIKVTNSDPRTSLLHVAIEHIPEDRQPLLLVTPPVSRVDAGKSQVVRFILRTEEGPLKTQRLKRVTFEGIAPSTASETGARIGVGVRQNLPVIIHPKGLPMKRDPWSGLQWSKADGKLSVRNDTPYVVRLSQAVSLLPMEAAAQLPRTYILPNEHLSIELPAAATAAQSVRLHPATVYGYAVDAFEAPLK